MSTDFYRKFVFLDSNQLINIILIFGGVPVGVWGFKMWSSRDVALVILFAVVNVATIYLVGQMAWLFSGIPGSNMAFVLPSAIINSVALLMYEGRRWRFLLQQVIFVILIIPTYLIGTPFDILPRIPSIINAIHADILFMTLYVGFKERGQLRLWVTICIVEFFLVNQLLTGIAFNYLFPPEFVTSFITVVILLLPVSIPESVIGALIGYRIYQRTKKLEN